MQLLKTKSFLLILTVGYLGLWPVDVVFAGGQGDKNSSVVSGGRTFIPLSDRDPASLMSGSKVTGSSVMRPAPANQAINSMPSAYNHGTQPTSAGNGTGAADNRFWAPPPGFTENEPTPATGGQSGTVWSDRPASQHENWGYRSSKPRFAAEDDDRFNYSEPDYSQDYKTPGSYNSPRKYDDYERYRSRRGGSSYRADPYRERESYDKSYDGEIGTSSGYDRQPMNDSRRSVWELPAQKIKTSAASSNDPFDYGDEDIDFPEPNVPYRPPGQDSYKLGPKKSMDNPPEGTYGNQWQ